MRLIWLMFGVASVAIPSALTLRTAAVPTAVSPTPVAVSTPTPARVPAELVGTWGRRDAYLIVGPTGVARFRWRTGWCGPGVPEPCDQEIGDAVRIGAHAEIGLSGPDPNAPETSIAGAILSVTPDGLLVVGPVTIVRLAPDLIELRQSDHHIELCRPPREPNFCAVLM